MSSESAVTLFDRAARRVVPVAVRPPLGWTGAGTPAPVLARSYAPATVSVRTIEAVVAVFASTVTR